MANVNLKFKKNILNKFKKRYFEVKNLYYRVTNSLSNNLELYTYFQLNNNICYVPNIV